MDTLANTRSRLLELPGELRNAIYRKVLLGRQVEVPALNNMFHEPALLKACKSTRADAGSIFYGENIFEVFVVGMDSAILVWWEAKIAALAREDIELPPVHHRITPITPKKWANLEEWVERHLLGVITQRFDHKGNPHARQLAQNEMKVVVALFVMAVERGGMPASAFKRVLAAQREVLGRIDPQWLD